MPATSKSNSTRTPSTLTEMSWQTPLVSDSHRPIHTWASPESLHLHLPSSQQHLPPSLQSHFFSLQPLLALQGPSQQGESLQQELLGNAQWYSPMKNDE